MIKGGPKIINDGLVLCLDAHDAKSYAGEPTTNVVTNTNLDTGWSKGYQSNIVYNDIEPPLGIDSQVVGHTRGSSSAYWYSYGDYAPQDPSVVYVVSMYVKTLDSNFRIAFYTANNSEAGRVWGSYITVPNDGKWHRVVWPSFTNPSNSQSDSLSFNFTYNGAIGDSNTKTWFCAPQMEAKSYATPFVDGSRSATNGWVDRSGNSNSGTLTNMIGTGASHYRDGQVIMPVANSYLDFDGSNDYVVTSSNYSLSGSQTFEVWFMIEGGPSSPAGLLTQHDHAVPANFGINHVSGNKLAPSIGYTDNTREYSSKTTVTTFSHDTLYHAALVYDSSANKVIWYVNGVYDNQYTLSKTPQFAAKPFQLGRLSYNYDNYYYNGRVYKASVYSKALTAADVLSNYNATKGRF